jgi:hypothetical protein
MTLSQEIRKNIRQLRNTAYAVIALSIGAILYSVITSTEVKVNQKTDEKRINVW